MIPASCRTSSFSDDLRLLGEFLGLDELPPVDHPARGHDGLRRGRTPRMPQERHVAGRGDLDDLDPARIGPSNCSCRTSTRARERQHRTNSTINVTRALRLPMASPLPMKPNRLGLCDSNEPLLSIHDLLLTIYDLSCTDGNAPRQLIPMQIVNRKYKSYRHSLAFPAQPRTWSL